MVENRVNRKKRKKKQRRKWILSFILLFFLSFVFYVVYEYNAGKNAAMEKIPDSEEAQKKEEERKKEFQGEEDEKKGKTNVLILGVDSRGEEVSRTDTIMIGQYDSDKETAKLVSIMRDTYVNIPGIGYNKINAAFAYGGPELLRQTIELNFGIKIEYYSIIDFQGFTHVVDIIAPDGIEINVEKDMYYQDFAGTVNINLKKGKQKLNGQELLGYARFRNDWESDFGRVRRQQQVMSILKDELVSFAGIMKLPRVVGTLQPYIETNMDTKKILSLGMDFLLNTPSEIQTLRIPLDDSFWPERHSHAGEVLEIDEETNRNAIQEFLNE